MGVLFAVVLRASNSPAVAGVAWAERQHVGAAGLQRTRDEAMSLLPKVQRGDHQATLRAIELVNAAGDRVA